jgi:hypothetical protein
MIAMAISHSEKVSARTPSNKAIASEYGRGNRIATMPRKAGLRQATEEALNSEV